MVYSLCYKEVYGMEIKTNIGSIPVEDYLDIQAMQLGFDDYEDLRANGFEIDGFWDGVKIEN